jgi:phosphoglycerol transferase
MSPIRPSANSRVLPKSRSQVVFELGLYLASVLITLMLLWIVMDLAHAEWKVPFGIPGDGVYYGLQLKTLLETGWVHRNPNLGAPFGLELYDFAHFDNLQLFIMKLIGLCVSNHWGVVLNVYFVLTFPLTTLTSMVLFRWLRVHALFAIVYSQLFSFQYYHFCRGQGHIMLASYFLVPLMVLVALWLCQPKSLFGRRRASRLGVPLFPRWLGAILICMAAASAGHYYACFGCFFFVLASVRASLRFRQWRNVRDAVLLVCVVATTLAINLLPNIAYWNEHGSNRTVSAKLPKYSEENGLKMAQMLLPSLDHRVRGLARITEKYSRTAPLVSFEQVSSSIGLVAGLGFVSLIALLASPRRSDPRYFSLHSLSLLNAGAVVLATIGGFGSLMAYLISPQIHGYNRISIYLALFGLICSCCVANGIAKRWRASPWSPVYIALWAGFILAFGVVDQTPRNSAPNFEANKAKFDFDAAFGQQIQEKYGKGSSFFMLPLSDFPFSDNRIGYEHFLAYLHTDGMKWSNPAMLFRRSANWQKAMVNLPPEELTRTLILAGFAGIYIDHRFAEARESALMEYLNAAVKTPPIHDGKVRYVYDLRDLKQQMLSGLSEQQLAEEIARVIPPVEIAFGGAFLPLEFGPPDANGWKAWRWCTKSRERMHLWNHTDRELEGELRGVFYPGVEQAGDMTATSDLVPTGMQRIPISQSFSIPMRVKPGKNTISLTYEGALPLKTGSRSLWFRIDEFSFQLQNP